MAATVGSPDTRVLIAVRDRSTDYFKSSGYRVLPRKAMVESGLFEAAENRPH